MSFKIKMFLLGFPNGLMGQIIRQEQGEINYTP